MSQINSLVTYMCGPSIHVESAMGFDRRGELILKLKRRSIVLCSLLFSVADIYFQLIPISQKIKFVIKRNYK